MADLRFDPFCLYIEGLVFICCLLVYFPGLSRSVTGNRNYSIGAKK